MRASPRQTLSLGEFLIFVRVSATFGLAVGPSSGCGVHIDDQLWACEDSRDCGEGWQCDPTKQRCIQAYQNINGVYDDRLVIGVMAYLGNDLPDAAVRTTEGLAGIRAYVHQVNRSGGIHGRKLELIMRSDDPHLTRTRANLEELMGGRIAKRKTFLVSGLLTDQSSLAAAKLSARERVPLWAPGSGLSQLEPDPPNRYVFHYRSRYTDEAEMLTKQLRVRVQPEIPAQNFVSLALGREANRTLEPLGEDIVSGAARALEVPKSALEYVMHPTDSTEISDSVGRLLQWMARRERVAVRGVRNIGLLLGLPEESVAADFIRAIVDQLSAARRSVPLDMPFRTILTGEDVERLSRVEPHFAAHSRLMAEPLRLKLASFGAHTWTDAAGRPIERSYGAGLVISQVVPYPASNLPGALDYRRNLFAFDPFVIPGEISFESYLQMRLLGEALRAHGRDLTTETFIQSLETLTTDLGIEETLSFAPRNHQATRRTWALVLSNLLEPEWKVE